MEKLLNYDVHYAVIMWVNSVNAERCKSLFCSWFSQYFSKVLLTILLQSQSLLQPVSSCCKSARQKSNVKSQNGDYSCDSNLSFNSQQCLNMLGGSVVLWQSVGLVISRSQVQILLEATLCNNLGEVVHTCVPLSPNSITWYQPKSGDALQLGR